MSKAAWPGWPANFLYRYWLKASTKRPNFFPPGDIRLGTPAKRDTNPKYVAVRSPWREFEFWFMIIQHAIVPKVSLPHAFKHWSRIRKSLMENARKRQLQLDTIY